VEARVAREERAGAGRARRGGVRQGAGDPAAAAVAARGERRLAAVRRGAVAVAVAGVARADRAGPLDAGGCRVRRLAYVAARAAIRGRAEARLAAVGAVVVAVREARRAGDRVADAQVRPLVEVRVL